VDIVLILVALVISMSLQALFAGLETAFISISHQKMKKLFPKVYNYKFYKYITEHPTEFISAVLIATNAFIVLSSTLATLLFFRLAQNEDLASILSALIVSPIMIIFCEITPKAVMRSNPELFLVKYLGIAENSFILLKPIVKIFSWINSLIQPSDKHDPIQTKTEIIDLLKGSDILKKAKTAKWINNALEFSEKTVKEVMTPRVQVKALEVTTPINEAKQTMYKWGYSRVPVYKDRFDNVVGIVYVLDFIYKSPSSLEEIAREPLFIPEVTTLDKAFEVMRKSKQRLAVAVDEFGGLAGVISIEDIAEEIVGDITDEFEKDGQSWEELSPGVFLVEADTDLDDLAELVGEEIILQEISEEADDVFTIGGLIISKLGEIPQPGKKLKIGNLTFIVEESDGKKLNKVVVAVEKSTKRRTKVK